MTSKPHYTDRSEKNGIDLLPPELADAIDALPLLDMVDTLHVLPVSEPKRGDPVATMVWQVEQLLKKIRGFAELGNEDAIKGLRDIGNSAAETLKILDCQENAKNQVENPSLVIFENHPIVKLRGDFTVINELLEQKIDEYVSDLPYPLPQWRRGCADDDRIVTVDVVDTLYWRNDIARKARADLLTSKLDSEFVERTSADPHGFLSYIAWRADVLFAAANSPIESVAAEIEIHQMIRRRLEERFKLLSHKVVPTALQRVASKSLLWPVSISAPEDSLPSIKSTWEKLNLGAELPFRVRRKGGGGASRNFQKGTAISFALPYLLELHTARDFHQRFSTKRREYVSRRLSQINDILLPDVDLGSYFPPDLDLDLNYYLNLELDPDLELKIINLCSRNLSSGHDGTLRSRWYLTAASLPEFPPLAESSKSKSLLEKWVEAALLRAEAECNGLWGRYPWWPACVTERAGYDPKTQRNRSIKEAVKEKLREGMKKLRK